MIAFDEFVASRKWCDDLGKHLSDAMWDDSPSPGEGWLYLDVLYIEHRPAAGWLNQAPGEWYLILGRRDWLTDDLADLEVKLYEFALSEGYCDDP